MGFVRYDLFKRLPADLQYFVSLCEWENPLLWTASDFRNDQKTINAVYEKADAADLCKWDRRRYCAGNFDITASGTLYDEDPRDFYDGYETVSSSFHTVCQCCYLRHRRISGNPEASADSSGYLACRSSKVQGTWKCRTRKQEGKKEKSALEHGLGTDQKK